MRLGPLEHRRRERGSTGRSRWQFGRRGSAAQSLRKEKHAAAVGDLGREGAATRKEKRARVAREFGKLQADRLAI
jgi:hypothetical protein